MRKRIAAIIMGALLACGCNRHIELAPHDVLSVEMAPGLFGWMIANSGKDHTHNGKVEPAPHAHIVVFVQVIRAERLRGEGCTVTINSTRTITFATNPTMTWTVEFPAGVGRHVVDVRVGNAHLQKILHIWTPAEAGIG